MLSLIPSHTYNLEQLWLLIRTRNLWLIKLRFAAMVSMFGFVILAKFVLKLKLTQEQFVIFLSLTLFILIYNLILILVSNSNIVKDNKESLNPMHISLLQIVLDLIVLFLFTYFTGSSESPVFIFFIFHMIIGSLILPGWLIYTICGLVVTGFLSTVILEFFEILKHQHLEGLLPFHFYNDLQYISLIMLSFLIMMVFSVFLANTISSQLYRREQELEVAYDKLEEAEKMKQKYTMAIVHEIKSPIVAVQSYLDLILGKYLGPVSESVENKIRRARTRTDESIQIINDILNLSKIKLLNHIVKTDSDVYKLIDDILLQRKSSYETKMQEVIFLDRRYDKSPVKADSQMLEIALSNLIGNAIKYTNEKGKIEVVLENDIDRILVIEVCDNGIGIPEGEKDKIFKDFFRSSVAKHKGIEGTGLGLTVVKQVAEAHGGDITFRSPSRLADKANLGTCFRMTLPME